MTDSKNSASTQIPDNLKSEFSAGRVIPFIGSGVSQELARTLGQMGDPRVATDLRDPSNWLTEPSTWVVVEPGTYPLGDAKLREAYGAGAALKPEKFLLKQAIKLSRFPVTNRQFAAFVADGGYTQEKYWIDENYGDDGRKWRQTNNITMPAYWNDPKWNGETQPVVGVSCFEAMAYCRWANCRLPTEREWEAAARGPKGWDYPWGNEWRDGICNFSETDLGATNPVGIFTESKAACGAEDLAGNVWEWCGDRFDDEEKQFRLVRGGSWYYDSWFALSAVRIRFTANTRDDVIGFRVVSMRQDS